LSASSAVFGLGVAGPELSVGELWPDEDEDAAECVGESGGGVESSEVEKEVRNSTEVSRTWPYRLLWLRACPRVYAFGRIGTVGSEMKVAMDGNRRRIACRVLCDGWRTMHELLCNMI
jgi:hypothetical protein